MKMKSVLLLIDKLWIRIKNSFSMGPSIYNSPNRFAPKLSLIVKTDNIEIDGYQKYKIFKDKVIPNSESYDLLNKFNLLKKDLDQDLNGKTLLDLGANSGFFTFLAYQNGATCRAIDMDVNYIKVMNEISTHFGYTISIDKQNIIDIKESADIVIALSLIHWVYSCTSIFNSMESLIQFFATLVNEFIIIEWVDPEDPAINCFKHLNHNINFTNNTYNYNEFMQSMNNNFSSIMILGETRNKTRQIYKAIK